MDDFSENMEWVVIRPSDYQAGRSGLPPDKAFELALVLLARGVMHEVVNARPGWLLSVPQDQAARAVREIEEYERENFAEPDFIQTRGPVQWAYGLPSVLLLLLFVLFSTPHPSLKLYPFDFFSMGQADAAAIMSGEWHRTLTALTLHADPAHVVANVAAGFIFSALAATHFGPGLAWLLIIAAGGLGNLVNAWAYEAGHVSVGFSTAVFGAAGLLAAIRLVDGAVGRISVRLIPLAAGLGLLSMLGSGGERTDLGAHLFGFLCGFALGSLFDLALKYLGRPKPVWDRVLGIAAILLLVYA